ncbi:MAG: phosphohistidine phosphatase [Epsilonproteobacteria bacterium]|nr:phosphohistidine phosphatase [Campylobacterota bacterium]
MRLLFIRHAKAIEREKWEEDDLLRPLTQKGEEKAREFFSKLPKMYDIDVIISSKATRSIQTANILKEFYPNVKYFETSKINPGAKVIDFEELIDKFFGYDTVAFIGHEPDFSLAISSLIGCFQMGIKIRKAGLVELRGEEFYELNGMLYPKLLRNLK